MNITVKEELLAYIDPLTADETDALERSLLAEGCRDALVLWGDILVDGHNRYALCTKHNIPFRTLQSELFKSMEDVHLWMIEQHLGRRSLSDFQRGELALRKKAILASQAAQASKAARAAKAAQSDASGAEASPDPSTASTPSANADTSAANPGESAGIGEDPPWDTDEPKVSRETLARQARISSNTILQIEKIQKDAAPELVAAVKAGTVSINAAATVASLPIDQQVAAVAGGRKELQQAARQVRQAKAVERTEPESPEGIIARLRQTVSELKAENAALKERLAALGGA